ncbi:hypothetical protein ZYGR_0AD06740 [Zygosaccharomyces rouxii]|uniref:Transcription activator of gluconeogenesis n=2 Tax=Zygosaccharomyces rouxii TaxID=4956 RepID=ERT1_ZYGRC|nr:uncharacterized protein ZYRO0G21582g [Zygosaccharomyces rouxii]C5E1J9.1 RecName: Full=Transcription activator of gluconeogenesis [Zygosaccharomyces rouxii CBS 732]KAH9202973.1 transcription activator of gluconeogenesis [Zygosaccharomyces rouxii]GAV51491.1 hypothetical protein ZYGR_0AD06740 [Zygosaccharomyces rouxii]CAR29983.1 ZYRO0G21582p [Zygosaccharomyces rouxii]
MGGGSGPSDEFANILPHFSQVDSSVPVSSGKKSRRNTHVACVNCSKWHVSCEAKRPCHRCVVKGLGSTCVDAPRKKSKYLAGIPDASLIRSVHRDNGSQANNSSPDNAGVSHHQEQQNFRDPQHIVHKSKFLSNAADSEYSILSHIINQDTLVNKIPIDLLYSGKPNDNDAEAAAAVAAKEAANVDLSSPKVDVGPSNTAMSSTDVYSMLLGPNSREIVASRIDLFQNHFPLTPVESQYHSLSFKRLPTQDRSGSPKFNASINQYYLNKEISMLPEVINAAMRQQRSVGDKSVSFALECVSPDAYQLSGNSEWRHSLRYSTSMEIYQLINEPFSHTTGFHHLYTYLRKRFNRKDLIEMSGCLAEFRPIFIACTASLTEQDMIFMEQCYQRTLLEYAKFIAQIGTPTCVWRRNGQISYVNEEFEILSGWNKEELLNKMTFIVEIMDDESVRDYFKTFAKVAYKDFRGSERMKTCNLLTPTRGQIIPCCCMWTLKRDVSGLPLMILGNFMPIIA